MVKERQESHMKKLIALIVTVTMMAMLCVGCSSSKDKEGAGENNGGGTTAFDIEPMDEMTTVKLGYFSGSLHSTPFYVMEQEGWLNELNMEFEYQSFINGPAMMEANSSWDVCSTGAPGAIAGMLGYDVSVIGIGDHESIMNLYVREDSPIYKSGQGHIEEYPEIYGTPEDWKGTTWVLPIGTTCHKMFVSTLDKLGLTTDDVEIINMDHTSALSAFKAGEADGLGCWLSVALTAEEEGFKKVGGADINGDIIATTIMATDDALENKFDAVCKIYELYYKTVEWLYKNPDKFAQYFYDTCEIEGVACTEEIAEKATESFNSFSLEEMQEMMLSEQDDSRGLASRKLNGGEVDVLETFDFFMDINTYTEKDRNFLIDNYKVTDKVAKEVQKILNSNTDGETDTDTE